MTLVESLVVMGIIGLLTSTLLPSLNRVRARAKAIVCISNLRQLGFAFTYYSDDYDGFAMPTMGQLGAFWWGKEVADRIDHRAGLLWPYLNSELKKDGVYECPAQRFGSYELQGKPPDEPDDPKWITSTYGYNGYYLSPLQSGWWDIKSRPWQKIITIIKPDMVFAFADTLIDQDSTGNNPILQNNALLDPPYLYKGSEWKKNLHPTTCFRHNEKTNVAFVDGHCGSMDFKGAEYVSPSANIGSVGKENGPHYVPDWRRWPTGRKRQSD